MASKSPDTEACKKASWQKLQGLAIGEICLRVRYALCKGVCYLLYLSFFAGSACHNLQQVMRRVCSQLSDLSAPTAFNIVR